MTDLNELLPADSGWILMEARGMNNYGQIVGTGLSPQHQRHAFLMTPDGGTSGAGLRPIATAIASLRQIPVPFSDIALMNSDVRLTENETRLSLVGSDGAAVGAAMSTAADDFSRHQLLDEPSVGLGVDPFLFNS
jgi:hypothetical protein